MTELLLVRHGETVAHADNRYTGSSDIELSIAGRAQAAELARWAAGAELDALWSSPLARAVDTAAPLAAATGLRPRVDERLRELDFGAAEGRTLAELPPAEAAAFAADPVGNHMPAGEHPRAAMARALDCVRDIAAAEPAGRVLVVTHQTLIRLILCAMLELPLADYRRAFPAIHNCALTTLRLTDGRGSLLDLNRPPSGGGA